jgi:hypothetical protein
MTNNINVATLTSTQNTLQGDITPSITTNVIGPNNITLNHTSSSINYQANLGGGITFNNQYSSSVSTAVNNVLVQSNIFQGFNNTLLISGSNTATRRSFQNIILVGRGNAITSQHSGSSGGHLTSTAILGSDLIVSASHTSTTTGGSTFVGRFNATGSLQESSQDAVFVVGTGMGAGSRRNALHIDSSNNTRITGSVSISGSLSLNGVTVPSLNGLITTGSVGQQQELTGSLRLSSGSLKLDDGESAVRITDYFNRLAVYKQENSSKVIFASNCNMDQVGTAFGVQSGSVNLTVVGGSTLPFRTGSNNTFIGSSTGLVSGSSNLFIGANTSFSGGTGNVIIGAINNTLFSGSNYNGLLSIGTSVSSSVIFKEGTNPLTIRGNTDISGSLAVTGNVLFASGSNKTIGTFVLDGANPGVATVSNSLVSSTSLIFLTKQTNVYSGEGTVSVTSKGSGTFSVTSNHNGDTDTVAYLIINPS